MLSIKLAQVVSEVQPPNYELSQEDTKALWQLMLTKYDFMREAGRFRNHGIEEDSAGQGENSRWGTTIGFPLLVRWTPTNFEGQKVTFTPELAVRSIEYRNWIFDHLATTFSDVEPDKEAFLTEEVFAIPTTEGICYCLASEEF